MSLGRELPVPRHYEPSAVGQVWQVAYQSRATEAAGFARAHGLSPSAEDRLRVALLVVDVQNTFCVPGFELFVAGRSGTAAVDDSRRLTEFVYRNLGRITRVFATLDTHQAAQIFHALFLVDENGNHPPALTTVTTDDVTAGRWRFNERLAGALGVEAAQAGARLERYVEELARGGRYALTIWPYHSMLGGIGHALVASVEEALFFHAIARSSPTEFTVKGDNPFTEAYSVFGPEVSVDEHGRPVARTDSRLLRQVLAFDRIIVAGQAKSHCVAWSVEDLLASAGRMGVPLAERLYLLEDCSSSVVVPGVVDYTDEADAAFRRFAAAGAHLVHSDVPMEEWPGTW